MKKRLQSPPFLRLPRPGGKFLPSAHTAREGAAAALKPTGDVKRVLSAGTEGFAGNAII
jgi:hypothetical protein